MASRLELQNPLLSLEPQQGGEVVIPQIFEVIDCRLAFFVHGRGEALAAPADNHADAKRNHEFEDQSSKMNFDATGGPGRIELDTDVDRSHTGDFVGSGLHLDLVGHIGTVSGTEMIADIVVDIVAGIVAAGVYSFAFAGVGVAEFVATHRTQERAVVL